MLQFALDAGEVQLKNVFAWPDICPGAQLLHRDDPIGDHVDPLHRERRVRIDITVQEKFAALPNHEQDQHQAGGNRQSAGCHPQAQSL